MADKRAYRGVGVLERFLYLLPPSKLGYRTHDKPPVSPQLQAAYHAKIKELLAYTHEAKTLSLSPNALERWHDFREGIEVDLRADGRLFPCQGWGGKICGFTLRLAGLLRVAEYGLKSEVISELGMANAIQIAKHLIEHALAAYGLMGSDPATEDAQHVFNWMSRNKQREFTRSDIVKAMRHKKCGKPERLNKALSVLMERNLISEPHQLPTRKPTTVYYFHPDLLLGGEIQTH